MAYRSKKTQDAFLSLKDGDKILVFDTETTGLKAATYHIIEFAAQLCEFRKGQIFPLRNVNIYIKPDYPLPDKIVELTGITDAFLADKPSEKEVVNEIYKLFQASTHLSAYNIRFDIGFVRSMFERYGLDTEMLDVMPRLDVLEAARDFAPADIADKKLGTVATLYGADKGIAFHCAEDDVEATVRLFNIFLVEYEDKVAAEAEAEKERLRKRIPKIYSIRYWKGFRGKSRLYVNASTGTFWYDIFNDAWGIKEEKEATDMEALISLSLAHAKCPDIASFKRYKGDPD